MVRGLPLCLHALGELVRPALPIQRAETSVSVATFGNGLNSDCVGEHLQVSTSGIEVHFQSLAGRPDHDIRQIHSVVLDIVGGDFANMPVVVLGDETAMGNVAGFALDPILQSVKNMLFAGTVDFIDHVKRAIYSRLDVVYILSVCVLGI